MKKIVMFVGLGFASILASAENRLFPTDVLNQGELDVRFFLDHQTTSSAVNARGNPGNQSFNLSTQSVLVRYGLGANWHIGASQEYVSNRTAETNYRNPAARILDTSGQGAQNPTLWTTYGFFNDKINPLSLTGEIQLRPKTTEQAGSYTGQISTGWKSSDSLKLYGRYSTTVTNDAQIAQSNNFSFGAYKEITDRITLIPQLRYSRFNATNTFSSTTQYGIGLSSNIEVSQNTYLTPSVSRYRNSSGNSNDGTFHRDSAAGSNLSLSLYHLF